MGMTVPFFDWKRLYLERRDEYMAIFDRTASRGGFILQNDVTEFEAGIAAYMNVKHAIAVSDATNAMLLGFRAIGLAPGDEVVVPSHSFIAAPQSIHHAGGTPVACDLDLSDGLVDVADMEARITSRTRVLMPVHVNGRVCDMNAVKDVASRRGLLVVEDSAQGLGAKYGSGFAGSFGLWGCFSFYPSKVLGTFGDAGMLVTNDDAVADKVRRMRNHGADESKVIPLDCSVWGTNCRMDNLHAAFLAYKLTWYGEAVERRREIARRYHDAFKDIPGLSLPPGPDAGGDHFDVFQNYEMQSDRRDGLRTYLAENGIGTIIQWGGITLHTMTGLGYKGPLPRTERFFERCLLLPMNHMLSDAEVDYVCDKVVGFHRGR